MRKLALAALLGTALGIRPVASAPPAPPAPPHGVLGVYVRGPDHLLAGTPAALRIATHWATSETVSGPWPAVEIDVRMAGGGRQHSLFHGRTDAQGLVDARYTVPEWPDGKYTVTIDAQAGARHKTETHEVELEPSAKLLLESDKPLYQPTQTIHLRALAVRPLDGKPLGAGDVLFTLTDPRGNRVFKESRPLSRFGVASVDFVLADEILTGYYRAQVALADERAANGLDLSVERYSLPKFKVSVETDKAWYRPGETVQLSLDSRYFFGKPVAGGKASVRVSIAGKEGLRVQLAEQKGALDADGKLKLRAELPAGLSISDGTVTLRAEVTDAAQHREEAARELPYSADAARVDVVAESEWLVPGVPNHVWIAATRPDGAPLAGAEVELSADGVTQSGKADAIGVAALEISPQRGRRSACGANQVELAASVRHDGVMTRAHKCVRLAAAGALLLRTDRAIYPLGAPMQVELAGLGADGVAYLDVVKDGQTVDTQRVILRGGGGHVTLPPDERRFGTLSLEAYRIAPDGTQTRATHLVYVERPAALRVDVHTDGTYRPGEPGRIRLKVVDAQTGKGTQAEVGVVMVDQSLLALKAMKPGVARVYFTLADEATRPQMKLQARPGGYTVERLIEEGQLDALKDEAARVLLAGAAAPWSAAWEVDPWQKRKDERDAQLGRLGTAMAKWAPTHDCGEPARGAHWRWRRDLVQRMIADGALPARDAHDPWGRAISVDKVMQESGLGDFDAWAQTQVEERMTQIYVALARSGLQRTLPRDPSRKNAVVLAVTDLEKLAETGKLPKYLLHDPWGQPWRLVERKRTFRVARLRSRWLLASAGPNGIAGDKDDLYGVDASWGDSLDGLRVAAVDARTVEVYGAGGLGVVGHGFGGGGAGYGSGIGMGRMGTIGHGAGVGNAEARVRRDFPETMLWRPDLVTDADGNATLDVTMADSITTWKLFAEAIALDGRLGQATAEVRVFQDFFVDLDLPPVITQHDELSVPVAVYNYLSTPQRVTLTLDDARWFTREGDATQTIDLQPSQVGVRYFRIRALGVGRQKLLVRAHGSVASDAIEKSVELRPNGVERSVAWQDRLQPGSVEHSLTLPANAIADASISSLKLYPSTATHVIEGLDSMLRMPGGCFEQTSSTTYPNALILDYLRRTKKATPDLEKKAREYLAAGWQRLLSFEVPGGGFSWFGQAPANQILTAYGLEEFHDMSRVFAVDERVIKRTQEWLVGKQRGDGSWAPDTNFINEGATNHFNSDVLRITAYVAVALEHSGYRGAALDKARAYVEKKMLNEPPRDAYTLALAGELFSSSSGNTLDAVLSELWSARADQPDGKTTTFTSPSDLKTPTYGSGKSGTVETTALATFAMLQGKAPLAHVDRAVGYLLSSKDTFGNWYSTQATILSLKALLAYGGSQQPARGKVRVTVDGRETAEVLIDASKLALTSIDLPALTVPGRHAVSVRFEGSGQLAYQLVDRWFEPRAGSAKPTESDLAVATRVDAPSLKSGATLIERIEATARKNIDMPIVTAGLPPGFDVDGEELDKLVKSKVVDKIQRTPTGLVLYLTRLDPSSPMKIALHLRSRFPERVQIPPATVYEYYRPERAAAGEPLTITVGG